jgi:2-polyprenyl-3-methyl-5-hydroxy-6-metoxy-1,4-benzoquinol methylase
MTDFAINKNGFWESTDSSGHLYDKPLSDAIISFFKNEKTENIIDLGCGMGNYVKALREQGFECDGFDGNPNTVLLTNGMGKVLDFSKPFDLHKKYDWVLSLEVGEHIPEEFEGIFLNNLVCHAKNGIILSWAIPGQPGDGHVNCKTNRYIITQMKKRGWKYDERAARNLREKSTLGWFKNTIMVFVLKNNSKNLNKKIRSFFRFQDNLRHRGDTQ